MIAIVHQKERGDTEVSEPHYRALLANLRNEREIDCDGDDGDDGEDSCG